MRAAGKFLVSFLVASAQNAANPELVIHDEDATEGSLSPE